MTDEFKPSAFDRHDKNAEFAPWVYQDKSVDEPEPVDEALIREQEYEALREQAREQGYREGLKQAKEDVEKKQQALLEMAACFQNPTRMLDEAVTQDLLQTLIWLCKQCIGIELSVNPEKLIALLEEVYQELPSIKGKRHLLMHSDDAIKVTNLFQDKLPDIVHMLKGDDTLERGDFYLVCDHNEIDGRLQSRLNSIFSRHLHEQKLWEQEPSSDE